MTDAAPADSLLDAFHSFAAVALRQPIEIKVVLALAGALTFLMIVDGIRANFFARKRVASLFILREPYGGVRGPVRLAVATPVMRSHLPKRSVRKASLHKMTRPGINRVPRDLPVTYDVYQPLIAEAPRETDTSPL